MTAGQAFLVAKFGIPLLAFLLWPLMRRTPVLKESWALQLLLLAFAVFMVAAIMNTHEVGQYSCRPFC